MSDPLAQFRKKPVGPGSETTPPQTPEGYVAFDAKDKVDRLKIRRANDPTRSPGYAYLLDVVYDGSYGTNFVLVYTFLMVLVKGRNLQNLIMALEMGTADFIQEFDPERWQKPTDEKAAFIESIEVVVQETGPSVSKSEESGNMKEKGLTRH
jgi:hypothetical protein